MRISMATRKISNGKKNKKRLLRSIVSYLKSDPYLFAPLCSDSPQSNSESSTKEDISMAGFETLGMERIKKNRKRRVSEKVKEYLKFDNHLYGPIISSPKFGSSLKEKLKFTKLVTTSSTTTSMKEDNNNKNLRSEIVEYTLQNGRLDSPKRALVILEGQRSSEGDLSPAFSSLSDKKVVKPDQRRVTIE